MCPFNPLFLLCIYATRQLWCDSANDFNLVKWGFAVRVGENKGAGDGEADWERVLGWDGKCGGVVEACCGDRAWRERNGHWFAWDFDDALVTAHWARNLQGDNLVNLEVKHEQVGCGERCAERNVVGHAKLFAPVPGAFV